MKITYMLEDSLNDTFFMKWRGRFVVKNDITQTSYKIFAPPSPLMIIVILNVKFIDFM